jgi:hypothetical protein
LLRAVATQDVRMQCCPDNKREMNMAAKRNRHVFLMALLTGLFALRVTAQAVQFCMPQSFLPGFDQFQGSSLAYSTLLLSQLLILALMLRTCLRVGVGLSVPQRSLGRGLAWFGGLYMAGSIARIVVGVAIASASPWFSAWIPASFHLVLAGFVLTAAHYHLLPYEIGNAREAAQ